PCRRGWRRRRHAGGPSDGPQYAHGYEFCVVTARPEKKAKGNPARLPLFERWLAWRAVHGDDAPTMPHARPVDMVDAGDRAILHREGEAGFRFEVERETERRADRPAMGDGDDVTPT